MPRSLIVEADGGSRGNPGIAGYGALVRDADSGALLAERAEPLGKASNNVAEYRGLIAGLTAALDIDPSARVEARMDSKLVVEQMSGRWKIKHEDMRRLALEARDLVDQFRSAGGSVSYQWIPREKNKDADALSNVAMDGDSVDRTFASGDPKDSRSGDSRPDEAPVVEERPAAPKGPGRGAVTRIVIVRHGVTSFTEEGRLDGRGGSDPSLSETGRAQAASAGRSLAHLLGGREARVVTSTLARAKETGAIIAEHTGATIAPEDAAFDEQSYGDWDAEPIADLLAHERDSFERMRTDPTYSRPGGESRADVAGRVIPAWDRLIGAGGTTVLVCHRMVIHGLLMHLLGLDDEMAWRLAIAPGSLTAVEIWENGVIQLAFVNRT